MEHLFDVISEDDEFLVINKPAGLVCHPTKGDVYSSLISRVRLHLGSTETPQMVNRLDRETSGIVMIGKTLEAGVGLRKLWESRAVHKEYLAIVHGQVRKAGKISAPLGPDPESEIAIKDKVVEDGGASAETQFFPLRVFKREERWFTLLRIFLLTGRKHQIRIHLAHRGHPIVGDKLYGGNERLYLDFVKERLTPDQKAELITENHALHAGQISFPWKGALRTYICPPEPWFTRLVHEKGPILRAVTKLN